MPDFVQIQVKLTIPQYLQWMMYRSMTFKGVDITLTKGGKSIQTKTADMTLSKGGKNIQTKNADINLSTFSHSVTVQKQS